MKLVISLRIGVLHRHLRAEFKVRADCRTELLIIGQVRRVERCHVELDEPLSLLLGDPQLSVDVDQMGEAELSGKAIRTTEGFSREGGQVIDMLRLAGTEEGLEQWIFEDAAVERVLEAVQCLFATCEFVE